MTRTERSRVEPAMDCKMPLAFAAGNLRLEASQIFCIFKLYLLSAVTSIDVYYKHSSKLALLLLTLYKKDPSASFKQLDLFSLSVCIIPWSAYVQLRFSQTLPNMDDLIMT